MLLQIDERSHTKRGANNNSDSNSNYKDDSRPNAANSVVALAAGLCLSSHLPAQIACSVLI